MPFHLTSNFKIRFKPGLNKLLLIETIAKLGESAFLNEFSCRGTALDLARHTVRHSLRTRYTVGIGAHAHFDRQLAHVLSGPQACVKRACAFRLSVGARVVVTVGLREWFVRICEWRVRIIRLQVGATLWRMAGDLGTLVLDRYLNGAHSMKP